MVDVRKVRVFVEQRLVAVPVLMRLVAIPLEIMFALVMLVVRVPMAMLHRLMHVLVLVMGSAHETEKIVRYALSCQPSTMIDMPSSATPAPVQSSADSFTPSTTRSQTSAVAT